MKFVDMLSVKCQVLCKESLNYELNLLVECKLEHAVEILIKLVQLSVLIKFVSFTSNISNICSFPDHESF